MTTKPSLLGIANSVILIAIIFFLFFHFLDQKGPTVVYVDNVVLFSAFNMSKDLNKIYQEDLKKQKGTVDSIVEILQNPDNTGANEELQRRFVLENNKLKEMGEYFKNNVSQQVWSRINSYIEEYGQKNNYSIIMGTQGNGNIMFAQKELDITKDFIEFANMKYEGK